MLSRRSLRRRLRYLRPLRELHKLRLLRLLRGLGPLRLLCGLRRLTRRGSVRAAFGGRRRLHGRSGWSGGLVALKGLWRLKCLRLLRGRRRLDSLERLRGLRLRLRRRRRRRRRGCRHRRWQRVLRGTTGVGSVLRHTASVRLVVPGAAAAVSGG